MVISTVLALFVYIFLDASNTYDHLHGIELLIAMMFSYSVGIGIPPHRKRAGIDRLPDYFGQVSQADTFIFFSPMPTQVEKET